MDRRSYDWRLPRTAISLGTRTAVMGILNMTPDSFSDAGIYFDLDAAVARGLELEQQGADILDIGGESTRPGSLPVGEEEEIRRILPVIEKLSACLRIPISVDTYRSGVARRAVDAGAQIVNDISGFRFDSALPGVVATLKTGVVLMHSRGERDRLHAQPKPADPVQTVVDGITVSAQVALDAGIDPAAVVIDPGIGFGKDAVDSLKVLKDLAVFSKLGYPLLVGTSRKSFIRAITQDKPPDARLWGTAASVAVAIVNGAHIVRVHDVPQMRTVAEVTDRILTC